MNERPSRHEDYFRPMPATDPHPPFAVVSRLIAVLGARLVAYIAGEGVSVIQVNRWATGMEAPAAAPLTKLRAALSVINAMGPAEGRAFLIGRNESFGGRTPADALRANKQGETMLVPLAPQSMATAA